MTAKSAITVADNDHQALALWAADCAEHVIQYFEAQRPVDDRPRRALESARARGEIRCGAARTAAIAAHPAAREADDGLTGTDSAPGSSLPIPVQPKAMV